MICTTLNKIREHSPCADGWEKLLKHLGKTNADDEPLPLLIILDSNGFDDCLWCLRTVPEHDREWRLFAVWCARKVQHLMKDERSIMALDTAERFANGNATQKELTEAWAAARDAASGYAAWAASWAIARNVSVAAASVATAWATARNASWNVFWAAAKGVASGSADWSAAGSAAWTEARAAQEAELRRILS